MKLKPQWHTHVILILLVLFCVMTLSAQTPPAGKGIAGKGLTGFWQGALQVAITLRLNLKISEAPDGKLSGTMDSVDQGDLDRPIDVITFKDNAVHLEVKSIGGVYDGTMNADGSEIAGQWKQWPLALALTLKRSEKPLTLNRPQEPKRPYPYAEEEVEFKNTKARITLVGTLTRPKSAGPFPVVLLITGSGPQDRDETVMGHRPFLILADYLTRRGIAVLRVDDRGVGQSTGNFATATTLDFADDVLAGVEFLKQRKDINPSKIGLIGHSEGGVIAPMVAAKSQDVAFIVLIAGTGVPGDELTMLQMVSLNKAAGATEEQLAKARTLTAQLLAIVKTEKDDKVVENKIRALDSASVSPLTAEQREAALQMQIQNAMSPWFRYFISYDPRPALTKVKCPVLAINGEKDTQVPPKENLTGIAQALKAGGNKDFQTVELPGLNHLLQRCTTGAMKEYSEIEETMNPAALKEIGDWIEKRVVH